MASSKLSAAAGSPQVSRLTADQLNAFLADGIGEIVVATYLRAWQYSKKHAGMFFEKNGNLYVKQGCGSVQLTMGDTFLVSVKKYRYVK